MRIFKRRTVLYAVSVIIIMALGIVNISGEDGVSVPGEYEEFINSVTDEVRDKLPDGTFSESLDEISDAAAGMSTPAEVIGLIMGALGSKIDSVLPTLALIIGIVVISALCYLVSSYLGGGVGRVVELCTRLCTFCAISGVAVSCVERLKGYFENLFLAVSSFIPLSATLYAMGGNVMGAASMSASLGAILTVCQFICSYTVIPVFCVCLCFSVISVLDGVGGSFGTTVSGSIRKWYTTALAFVMMILTSTLASQSILSSKADSAAMRGVKFAISSFVPLSGGTVSSTLGTLASGVELLRGSVGVIGIVIIIMMLVPTVIELALIRAVLGIGSFCAGLLGCSSEQRLLSDIGGLYGYLEGVALLCSVIFLIAFGIFASVATPFS